MQFILRDGHIHIVNNTGLANNNIEATVVTEYVHDHRNKKFKYSINGGTFAPLENGKIIITKDLLKKSHLDLSIRAIGEDGFESFTVDSIPLTYAVVFGKNIEEAYPEKFHQLEMKIDRITQTAKNILEYVEELEKKGRLL